MPNEQTAVPTVYAIDTENEMRLGRENNKPKREGNRCFMIMVTLLVILFAALFATLFVLFKFKMYPKTERSGGVCDSDDCIRMAAVFKKTMDPSVNPCDNFAKYACGKWSQSYLMPDSYSEYSWFEYIYQRQARKLRDLLRRNLTDVYGAKLPRAVLQAQKLYNSCVDTESQEELGLDPLVAVLKKFDLPKIPPSFLDQVRSTDLIRQAALIKKYLYIDVFFKVEVYVDLRNVSQNLIVIGSPSSGQTFRSWSDYHDRSKIHKYLKLFPKDLESDDDEIDNELKANLMTNVIREMISNYTDEDIQVCQDISAEDEKRVDNLVVELINMKDYIYENGNSLENETSGFDDTYDFDELPEQELMHVDSLQKLTDDYVRTINSTQKPLEIWKPFIEELFKDILKPNWRTRYKLWVYDLKHLQRVALLFTNTDKNLLESWAWWSVLESVAPYSSKNMHKFWTAYVQQMYGLENINSRSFQCIAVVNKLMGIATSWLYFFDETFIEEDVSHIWDMVRYLKTAFADLVIRSDWVDRTSKLAILRKNAQPMAAIGYPEWLFMDKKLDELNSIKGNLSEKNLLANVFYIMKSKVLSQLQTLTTRNYRDVETWVEPVLINAYHVYEKNQIIIPASILTFPFYTSSLKSVNYGFIGAGVIGHELAHGFDDLGRRFDEFGNYKQCWSNETIAEYVSKAQCYIHHYNGYRIEETESYVNGEATLNENLADALGLKQAFFGYQQWKERHEVEPKLSGFTNLTHEQLFFLSYAVTWCQTYTPTSRRIAMSDEHAPMDVRILGTLRNSKEFSEAWQCPIGSYMNPKDKCSLW